jgi:hypothetical protein
VFAVDLQHDSRSGARHCGRMKTLIDLEALGREFLAALVARLGPEGAERLLRLLMRNMETATQREPSGRVGRLNG